MQGQSHPFAVAIREAYEAAFHGDLEPTRRLFWPDCVIHVPGSTPVSGDIRGWDEAVKWSAQMFERGGKSYFEDVVSTVASDHWAFMFTIYHAERKGRRLEDRSVNVYRLRDGRVAEMWVLLGDCEVFNEIFG
jgi:uncharacterized protein